MRNLEVQYPQRSASQVHIMESSNMKNRVRFESTNNDQAVSVPTEWTGSEANMLTDRGLMEGPFNKELGITEQCPAHINNDQAE